MSWTLQIRLQSGFVPAVEVGAGGEPHIMLVLS